MDLINKTPDLVALCKRLSASDFVTVDTEFHRETTYWPLLCLIQIAGPDEAHCIDALSQDIDLSPLYELFQNKDVIKVFHAARQDLEIFFHRSGIIPAPMFDSQVAAMVCGFGDSAAYSTLVNKLTKVQIDKSQRFTDWSRRPLMEKQLAYALADVTHLRDIYIKLSSQLAESGRSHWVEEEMEILQNPSTYSLLPAEAWKKIKSKDKKPRFLAVLKEVAAWRERTAQEQDVPRRRIAKDDVLIELATHKPTNEKALSETRLAKHYAKSKHAPGMLAAVSQGLETPDKDCPLVPRPPNKPANLGPVVDLLKVLLKARCDANGVAQKLIASIDDLEQIAIDDDAKVRTLYGWRRALFGDDALKLKHGVLALTLSDDKKSVAVIERK